MNLSSSEYINGGATLCPLSSNHGLPSAPRAEVLAAMATAIPPTILKLAECIEADLLQVVRWFQEDPISSLGGLTAKDLVASGKDQAVVDFLRSVKRDKPWKAHLLANGPDE